MNHQIPEHMLRAAAGWHARLSATDCSSEDRAAYERWRARDPQHAQAFDLVQCTSERVNRLMRDDARLAAMTDAAFAEGSATKVSDRRSSPRHRWAVGLAASVIVALASLRFIPELTAPDVPISTYATAAGETRTIRLADGSDIHLDAGSRVEVQLGERERNVVLTAGRAYFKVAKDAARPFAVTANHVRTVALGTEFQVQCDSADVIVTLAEGAVEVSDVSQSRWSDMLAPGDQIRVARNGGSRVRRQVNVAHVADWSRGRHEFQRTPLAEVVTEINRYSNVKVRLGDPSLATLELGGNFLIGDSEQIVSAITAVLPVRAVEAGSQEVVLFPRYDAGAH